LAIAKYASFAPPSTILDVGTGGGFPGIPLALLFPQCKFTLIDAIGKKIMAVNEIIAALKLQNVIAIKMRAEELPDSSFDFVVSRAVTDLSTFITWIWKKIIPAQQRSSLPNGILCLKGGDLTEELKPVKQDIQVFNISSWFKESFFDTKKIVYIRR
jgi:16S rRNA (guanine527-N7)-methyltransferase